MEFLLKRPLILIAIVVIAVIAILSASGIFSGEPEGLVLSPITELESIKMGENTTLTVKIENKAAQPIIFELHLVYTNENMTFYDAITGERLQNITMNPTNFSLIHPDGGPIDIDTTIPILISGPKPKGSSETFRIFVELYSIEDQNLVLRDRKSVQLTVTNS
jgi:hypothetical protein